MRTLIVVFLSFSFFTASAQKVWVGILYDIPLRYVVVAPVYGTYTISCDNNFTTSIDNRYAVKIQPSGDSLKIFFHDGRTLITSKVSITSGNRYAYFRLSHNLKPTNFREYDDGLKVTNRFGTLLLVNEVEMNDYLCGVIEKEAGKKKHPEFFKIQAVLCRTYWAKARPNHTPEGFELCDGVHCQAFMGRSSAVPAIVEAVLATENMIVCDTSGMPVTAVFHSNCGGETEAAENVWSQSRPYLKPVKDPYCRETPNANWTKTISMAEWISYLQSNGFKISDDISSNAFAFEQPVRMKYYRAGNDSVTFVKIRNDLKLKSAFFSVTPGVNEVKLYGRGFGHGVGMCQEGAMQMAKKRKSYEEILRFYFSDVIVKSALNEELLCRPKEIIKK
jgi:stage II sporulation protein D